MSDKTKSEVIWRGAEIMVDLMESGSGALAMDSMSLERVAQVVMVFSTAERLREKGAEVWIEFRHFSPLGGWLSFGPEAGFVIGRAAPFLGIPELQDLLDVRLEELGGVAS